MLTVSASLKFVLWHFEISYTDATISIPSNTSVSEGDNFVTIHAELSIPESGGSLEWPITITLSTFDIEGSIAARFF